ncbi:hypothetical protein IEQ11_12255 [Lysobacter capsici]|jgi:hypothetical protein|uniref:hypothetical protein n=1 Tax=Lysobacter capsici TaxID=435897 RepID=UPI00177CC2D8|nr:hypothetical protein [Lysobacter capsici]UOF17346.1 hypothetical protein IEQ11_12255 [Lysobacter capsici]
MDTPNWKKEGDSQTSPLENKQRKEVEIKKPLRENVIFVGSEMNYDSFWLKMMFIAASYRIAKHNQLFRTADKTTLAYVDNGYVRFEKLTLDYLAQNHNCKIQKITKQADIATLLNEDRENHKLQDVAFFSHGIVGKISLNYDGATAIDFDEKLMKSVSSTAFTRDGRLFSYACRTGVSVEDWKRGFNNESEAAPQNSLAQKLADHFDIEVHAYLRRTFYGDVLRAKAQSAGIASTLKSTRDTRKDDTLIVDLPPEHEALPHPGLADNGSTGIFGYFERGAIGEGTDNYALWRKQGGRVFPTAADSPKGLPTDMRRFVSAKRAKAEAEAKKK